MTQCDHRFNVLALPLHFHCWDEECVVFNSLPCDTHQLSRATVEVLERLAHEPADVDALVMFFAGDAIPVEVVQLNAEFQDLLENLEKLALIARITS